jgi:hypothetical protein
MTNPFQVSPSGTVIQGQGDFGAVAQGIGGVLSAMQQSRENQFRMQELANAQAQQQALERYYQAQSAAEQQRQNLAAGSALIEREGKAQVGGVLRRILGGDLDLTPPSTTTSVPSRNGGAQMPPGVMAPGARGLNARPPAADASAGVFQQLISSAAGALDPSMARVLQGVSDENVPAAVDAVRGLQPKPEELPTAGKEFQFLRHLAQTDPAAAKFFYEGWIQKQPGVTVNNIPAKGQTAFAVKDAENQAASLAKAEEAARGAVAAMPQITEAYGILRDGRAYLGLGAKQKLFAGRVAAALGVPSAEMRTSNTQTLWRLAGETTLSYLRSRDLGSGTAVSNSDRDYMASLSGQDLTMQPVALRRTMRINFGALIMKQADAIAQLKAQAIDNPEMATSLLRRERTITRQYEAGWKQYARMLAGEGITEAEIRSRMVESGIQDPDPLLRGLPKPPTLLQEADSLERAIRGRR